MIVVRIVLGGLMLAAGIGKLANPAWRTQAAGLGVTRRELVALPWLEVVSGALLVAGIATRAVGVAVLVGLVAFTAVLVRALRRGLRPPCACFGGRKPRPISWWSVGRNAAMIAAALAVVVRG